MTQRRTAPGLETGWVEPVTTDGAARRVKLTAVSSAPVRVCKAAQA